MNNTQWLQGMHHQDSNKPAADVSGERMYTLFMRDFLKMPDMDFKSIALADTAVRALLN